MKLSVIFLISSLIGTFIGILFMIHYGKAQTRKIWGDIPDKLPQLKED